MPGNFKLVPLGHRPGDSSILQSSNSYYFNTEYWLTDFVKKQTSSLFIYHIHILFCIKATWYHYMIFNDWSSVILNRNTLFWTPSAPPGSMEKHPSTQLNMTHTYLTRPKELDASKKGENQIAGISFNQSRWQTTLCWSRQLELTQTHLGLWS